MINKLIVSFILIAFLFTGCGQEPGTLSPDQVDESMVDQIVKVKGTISFAVENPMGIGGMYMKLGDSKSEVDVRIQPELWDSYTVDEKAKYREGKTVTVEGLLSKAGLNLVIVHGKYSSANTSESSDTSTN